jgi:hypothetical protein
LEEKIIMHSKNLKRVGTSKGSKVSSPVYEKKELATQNRFFVPTTTLKEQ